MASIATSRSLSGEEHGLRIDTDLGAVECICTLLVDENITDTCKDFINESETPLCFGFNLALIPISHNQVAPNRLLSIEPSRRMNAFSFP